MAFCLAASWAFLLFWGSFLPATGCVKWFWCQGAEGAARMASQIMASEGYRLEVGGEQPRRRSQ